MFPPLVAVFYLPVAAWIAAGCGLVLAYRRSTPALLLRLAATFLALWALLATTTLVWVLANGGWAAVLTLLRSPLLIFEPRYYRLWVYGGIGALAVVSAAFLLNQWVGRGLLHVLKPRNLPWPLRLPHPRDRTSLLAFTAERPEAFSFTLLEVGGGRGWRPHRHEVVLLSTSLLGLLSSSERDAAIAHELGHVRDLDSRYLTFVRTFSRMMRWDPLLAYLAHILTRREEYRADLEAVKITRNPLALARAIYKVLVFSPPSDGRPIGSAFLGPIGRRGRSDAIARIQRLVEMAEQATVSEAPIV